VQCITGETAEQSSTEAERPAAKLLVKMEKMVGVTKIELATPAMSTHFDSLE
jgi:hypothetical protein